MPPIRLILKPIRFELAVFAMVSFLVTAGMVVLAVRVADLHRQAALCTQAVCAAATDLDALGPLVPIFEVLTLVVPVGAGIILGAPLVAAEIERRTAALAWSIVPSRLRWLGERLLVLGAVVTLLAVLPAIAATWLTGALHPEVSLGQSFVDYQMRGALVVTRAILAFSVAVLAGALIGRVLPAVLLGTLVFVVLIAGLGLGFDAWHQAEAVDVGSDTGALLTKTLFRDASGRLLTGEEVSPDAIIGQDVIAVEYGEPGSRVGVVMAREGAISVSVGIVMIGATAAAVRGRRPN